MTKYLLLALLLAAAISAPVADKMTIIPGYPADYKTSIYTGYLDLKNQSRAAHYVFVESVNGANNKDPVTLWLNGGPGCSSLLGFIQEIGPYYLEDGVEYKEGDNLTENKYSWHKASNLLFLESPAGVGFSYNLDKSYQYTDVTTAQDNFNALLDFFKKFPEYQKARFWIAGESYAGKYIPDLAVLIDKYNQMGGANTIDFRGMLIGNGIISFDHLEKSSIDYMIDRHFTDPETLPYYTSGCQFDPHSAGCRYFKIRFQEDTDELNPYNVYGYCYYNDSFTADERPTEKKVFRSQQSILKYLKSRFAAAEANNQTDIKLTISPKDSPKYNAAPCAYFDGMFKYFNVHEKEYHAKWTGQLWNGPCAENITYHIDPSGSVESYRYLLGRSFDVNYQIHLYSGSWDDVVPYHDTIAGIRHLDLVESYLYTPWFVDLQHAGFIQIYSGVIFTFVKGASHQVPQTKRAEALDLFNSTIQGHKELIKKYEQYRLNHPDALIE